MIGLIHMAIVVSDVFNPRISKQFKPTTYSVDKVWSKLSGKQLVSQATLDPPYKR